MISPAAAVTAAEWQAGAVTDPQKLQHIVDVFKKEGVVVVDNVVPHNVLDAMAARLDHDAAHQVFSEARLAEGRPSGHLACGLPRQAPWVFPEIVCNPIIEQIVVHCLGGAAFIRYYNGNTSLPGSGVQELHMDGGGWSCNSADEATEFGLEWPHEPLKLFVNFSCSDMTPECGSTECWLGSHLETRAGENRAAVREGSPLVQERRRICPPVQITVPKGAAAFRDLRVWHRGMPNTTDLPRHMISLGYGAERDPAAECSHLGAGKHRHLFSETARSAFQTPQGNKGTSIAMVDRLLQFVPGDVDHFGNRCPDTMSSGAQNDCGIIESGPYTGNKMGPRFQFWLPADNAPVPSHPALPDWARQVQNDPQGPCGGVLQRQRL